MKSTMVENVPAAALQAVLTKSLTNHDSSKTWPLVHSSLVAEGDNIKNNLMKSFSNYAPKKFRCSGLCV